jgi:hypothetical protein
MAFADAEVTVGEIGAYHGGDVLYAFAGVPGYWHEELLELVPPKEIIRP